MPLGLEKVALMAASGGAEETYVPTKDHTVGGYSDSGYNFVNTVFTASSNSWATATAYSEAGWTGFFDHTLIVDGQNEYWFGNLIPMWGVFTQPLGFILFFTALMSISF